LNYLGLTDLTEDDRGRFRDCWREVHREGFIGQIETIYADILPYWRETSQEDNYDPSAVISRAREREFERRLGVTDLEDHLKRGIPLDLILERNKPTFATRVVGERGIFIEEFGDLGIGDEDAEGQ
jgi:hypothetical protein